MRREWKRKRYASDRPDGRVYAVMVVATREVVYSGRSVGRAAVELVPGTVHGSGRSVGEAIDAALRACRESLSCYVG